MLLALDTATPATVVGLAGDDGALVAAARHDPAPGERPGHARELLALCARVLGEAGASWSDVSRIGAGVGPGTFTGLRIGIATARALVQATGAQPVAVPTLGALAHGRPGNVLACLDARRGEAFVAAYADGRRVLGPAAWRPERLAEVPGLAPGPWTARGDGADRFAARLQAAGVAVEPGARVEAAALCALAAAGTPVAALTPDYVRDPDAVPR
jgi:tRNA threonylcarbamoyladenosine biosynthesis protein TsaB